MHIFHHSAHSFFHRLRNFIFIGGTAFAIDIGIILSLIHLFEVNYLVATMIGFVIAFNGSYVFQRNLTFYGTERSPIKGYLYFLLITSLGLTLVSYGTFCLVEYLHLDYLLARMIVAGVAGTFNFLINGLCNFRVL